MKRNAKLFKKIMTTIMSAIMIGVYYTEAFAMSETVLPVTPMESEVIAVELPVVPIGSDSVFDFIIDPQGLINATNAVRYGGMSFEEEATLYFKNTDGEYDYSRYSDKLTITNRSTVPVRVTITAWIENLGELQIAEDDVFEDDVAEVFMAVVDDEGTYLPLDDEGKVAVTKEMAAAFDTYSFGLTGACNPHGDWSTIAFRPIVNVTWSVEPIAVEKTDEIVNVSGNDLSAETFTKQTETSVSTNDTH